MLLAVAIALSAHAIDVGGVRRTYETYVPATLAKPAPLLLAFHGHFGTGKGMARLTGLDAVADRRGFVVVYPDGLDRGWNDGRPGGRNTADDLGFTKALIARVLERYPIDPKRVYATGMSNGATFVQYLGCSMAGTFAALATVDGSMIAADEPQCHPSRPVSMLTIAGTDDPIMPFGGGEIHLLGAASGGVLSYASTLAFWARQADCAGVPAAAAVPASAPADGTSVSLTRYRGCRAGASVEGYAVAGGGHTWPGGPQYAPEAFIGRTSGQLDATRAIVNFFLGPG